MATPQERAHRLNRRQAERDFEDWWMRTDPDLGQAPYEFYAPDPKDRSRMYDAMRDAWLKARGFEL